MTPVLGIIASSTQQGRAVSAVGSYDALASIIVPSGGLASFTFAGIPTGYQHLQIRCSSLKSTNPGTLIRINGDGGTVGAYSNHILYGTGSGTAQVYTDPNYAGLVWALNDCGSATIPSLAIIDILNYASTTKLKSVRAIGGADLNGSGQNYWGSGMYVPSTAAITSITFSGAGANFNQNSRFDLYGVK